MYVCTTKLRTMRGISYSPRYVLAGLLLPILIFALFPASVGAQINPSSQTQVPLPKAFGEPDSVGVLAAMGAVSDSIPIVVVPGRRGIQPRLSLSYSSMAGDGVAGLGWGIGTGNVERWRGDGTPSVKATIEGTPNDRYSYSLAGAGGALHDDNGDDVYRARIESVYRPFRKDGDGWLMYDGQGVSYTFGSSQASRIDDELWLLDRVQDPSGNTILYIYETECDLPAAGQNCDAENNTHYLGAIRYTGFAPTGDLGANRITFEYEQRPDQRFSYRRGVREAQNLRLRQITV